MEPDILPVPRQRFKRRIIIIKGPFQLRFAALFFFICFLFTILVGIDIYITINPMLTQASSLDPALISALRSASRMVIVKMTVYSIIAGAVALFISHWIAGPIFKFEKSCAEVGKGDLSFRVKLRKRDMFFKLQDRFNLMVSSLQSKLLRINRLCNELTSKGYPDKARDVQQAIKELFKLK